MFFYKALKEFNYHRDCPQMVMFRVQYCGVSDGFWIQRAAPSIFGATVTRDPAGVASFWRPATRGSQCQ